MGKGMKIGSTDFGGSTPLHWACYSGAERAVAALLAWGAEIDCQ
jgi:ankyrin repeat protein